MATLGAREPGRRPSGTKFTLVDDDDEDAEAYDESDPEAKLTKIMEKAAAPVGQTRNQTAGGQTSDDRPRRKFETEPSDAGGGARQGNLKATQLLTFQGTKSVHQMVLDGNWTTSWKCVESWVSDPCRAKAYAASELELGASLGSVKVVRELVKRSRQISQWPAVEERTNEKRDAKGKGKGGGKKEE